MIITTQNGNGIQRNLCLSLLKYYKNINILVGLIVDDAL